MGEETLGGVIDPRKACLFIPVGLKDFKLKLFERIGSKLGSVIRGDVAAIATLPKDVTPIVGCSPELRETIAAWRRTGRRFVYWDRGYARRVFATWLPRGADGGFYRWHVESYQLREVRDLPSDRWVALNVEVRPWQKSGRHIVIAAPTRTYSKFHGTENWIADTIDALARVTDRQLVIRDKESKRSLQSDLDGAHALVSHGSIAAVESVILGCPVFVHPDSAAALVGQTDLKMIENPAYPERQPWLNALAYSQFNEQELVDGTLWKLLA
jgi:hypothetical protein